MTAAIGPLLALVAVGMGLVAFVRLPPRRALAALVISFAIALGLLRQFAIAGVLGMVGANLWQRAGVAGGRPSAGQRSEARTQWLAMVLDHDTGAMEGEVLEGDFVGRRLSDLSAAEMQALLAEIEAAGDNDSLSLLHAWLDRQSEAYERQQGAAEPPQADGRMSEAEALRILGLEPGATIEEIRAAHRRLIKRVHPDLGGSGALAAMINAAKERLDAG